MGQCINHPDRDTQYLCMKRPVYLCEVCQQCKAPKIYCRHRSACPIWFMSKHRRQRDAEEAQAAAAAAHAVTAYRREARDICSRMTYIDFSSSPKYMDEFTSALFWPHTDLKAFPSARTVA